jgi:predicted nucleic acid-binding protein
MATRREFLVDTSALNRVRLPTVGATLTPLMETDAIASCAIVDLEALFSARDFASYEGLAEDLAGLLAAPITPDVFARARAVQRALARTGHHRLPVTDLVIAATAELANRTLLHYDAHYEQIATVTAQPQQWVVPRGSV